MKAIDLIRELQQLDEDAEICIVDYNQDNCYDIVECRTTDGMKSYMDLVADIKGELLD